MKRRTSIPKSDINITPLIDVLLVLIVIFMVITPTTQKGFHTQVPQPANSSSPEQPTETLVLTIDRDGSVRLNQELLEPLTMLVRLTEVFSRRADRTIFVQADKEVLFNEVAQVIDAARGAGADRVGLMPQK